MPWRRVCVLLPFGVACGSSHTEPSPSADAGANRAGESGVAGAPGGSGAPAVAGASGESNEAGAAGLGGSRGSARISLVSLPGSPQFDGCYARVTFRAPGASDPCTATRFGDCELRSCAEDQGGVDAGRIYLVSSPSGCHLDIDAIDGVYPPQVETGSYPAEGDPVSASAAGHTAPQFLVDTSMPFGVVVSSPARAPTSGVVTVPRSEALVLRWGGGAAAVQVEVEAADLDTSIRCAVDATLGRMTIPESLLGALDPGTPLVVTTVAEATDSFGDYDFSVLTAVGVYDESHERLDFALE